MSPTRSLPPQRHLPARLRTTTVVKCCKETGEGRAPQKSLSKRVADSVGVSMGPISLTFSDDFADAPAAPEISTEDTENEDGSYGKRIHSLTTAEWRERYEKDGTVDLWVEEEYNAGSRLTGGRDVHFGDTYGIGTGEGVSQGSVATHHVTIHNRFDDRMLEVEVPEDRYVLWEAEDKGLKLPFACRMGCCTACAVRVLSGKMYQPQALGISKRLKEQGYALMCVGYPETDLVLETVNEDEVYDLQFGRQFEEQALNKTGQNIERDDFALELADMDE